jgi:hypothetical protein
MLQTWRSRFPYPMRWFFKFTWTFRPHCALGFTQPLTEMSTRNIKLIRFLRNKVRRVHRPNNLTAICELAIPQPYMLPRPVTEIALLYGDGVCYLWGTNWTVGTALQVASISQLTVSRLSRQCGILNISQPYRFPWSVTGTASHSFLYINMKEEYHV